MTALTQNRNTPRRETTRHTDPVAADVVIFAGALVALNAAGNAVPASTATGLVPRGRANEHVDTTGLAAGALSVTSDVGVFRFANSAAADEITRAHIGDVAYIVDDQTVALTDGTGTRSAAGTIRDVDAAGVWVEIA